MKSKKDIHIHFLITQDELEALERAMPELNKLQAEAGRPEVKSRHEAVELLTRLALYKLFKSAQDRQAA